MGLGGFASGVLGGGGRRRGERYRQVLNCAETNNVLALFELFHCRLTSSHHRVASEDSRRPNGGGNESLALCGHLLRRAFGEYGDHLVLILPATVRHVPRVVVRDTVRGVATLTTLGGDDIA